jgi:hypothetical protein
MAKRLRVTHAQGAGTSRLNLTVRIALDAPPKDIVLPTRIEANHRPHSMVVRHHRHCRGPDHVEDGQIRCVIELLKLGTLGFAQSPENACRIGYCAGDNFMDEFVGAIRSLRRTAIGDELIQIEHDGHRDSHPRVINDCLS